MAAIGPECVGLLALPDELLHFRVLRLADVIEELGVEMRAVEGVVLDADQIEDDVFGDGVVACHIPLLPGASAGQPGVGDIGSAPFSGDPSPYRALVTLNRGSGFETLEEPIRAELFSVERLEQHAQSLAESQELSGRPGRFRLISQRLADNGEVLLTSYRELSKAIREEALLTPAAEWLVDNFHLVESQLREIRENLPASYYRELPKLDGGHLDGYPRVYGIAWAYIAHLDSRFDSEALARFVGAYQQVEPLSIGELWALPLTLRLILIENLRRLAETIVWARRLRREADGVADGLLGLGNRSADDTMAALGRIGAGRLRTAIRGPTAAASSRSRPGDHAGPDLASRQARRRRNDSRRRGRVRPIAVRRRPTSPCATS